MTGWRSSLTPYFDSKLITILFLGVVSGLPLLLTLSTLTIWLAELGVSLQTIGLFALVGVPYSLKFLWAPVMDHLSVPILTRWLGRRRGWLIFTQILLMGSMVGLGFSNPVADPFSTAVWAVAVAFCSASQDIVLDAYRVEILEKEQYGHGAAMVVFGYRVGLLISGAGALYLASFLSWPQVYMIMAACMLIGVVAVLCAREPDFHGEKDDTHLIARAVIAPFMEFMKRQNWMMILLFIFLFKLGDAMLGVMANPFYVEMGFSKIEIANISKLFGLAATLIGGFIGGAVVHRYGIYKSLVITGVLQLLSNGMFVVQAIVGHDVVMLAGTIGVENLTGGMGTAAFVAYLSALCHQQYTATQYALLSSLMSVGRTTLASSAGFGVAAVGWVWFFVLTIVIAVPGLLMLVLGRKIFLLSTKDV